MCFTRLGVSTLWFHLSHVLETTGSGLQVASLPPPSPSLYSYLADTESLSECEEDMQFDLPLTT